MMEVTPHLKSVLKNYQHSATKSLQGPGLSMNPPVVKNEASSPEENPEEEFQPAPAPFPVQQVPILAAADTSCSERSETILEGEAISCFVVGGEKRLCLPQVLNSVLRDFSLQEINRECDQLQIYCSRCTPEQLNVLKSHGILPSGAPSCGLITKTDAERLCSALLFGGLKNNIPLRPRKGLTSFPVYHECFGEARGLFYPDLYISKHAKCIECSDCDGGFSPQQFVCHVHRNLENRTVHWGFDSSSHWRAYLHVPDEQSDQKALEKVLDEVRDRYEGKVPFPPPPVVETTVKRKQIPASDLVKDHQASAVSSASELPLKKQKLDEYLAPLNRVPFHLPTAAAAIMQQSIYSLEPLYMQRIVQEFNNVRSHLSAFKPVAQSIREQKIRSANAMGLSARVATDPPLLQNPERVVMLSESERFERSYQPNVALAPPTPKKHRYGRAYENITNHVTSPQQCSTSTSTISSTVKNELHSPHKAEPPPQSPLTNGHYIKEEADLTKTPPSTPPEKIDSTVSVLQTNNSIVIQAKYNPEIELSTDTEDSASETSEKNNSDYAKLEEVLKSVNNDDVREKVLELFRNLAKERERAVMETRSKDQNRIVELERKNSDLELENSELRRELEELRKQTENNNKPVRNNLIKDNVTDLVTSSSIIIQPITEDKAVSPAPPPLLQQKSVIASVASVANSVSNSVANSVEIKSEVIKNTAPE